MGRPRVVKNISRNFDLTQGKLGEHGRSDYAATYVRHKNYRVPGTIKLEAPPIRDGTNYPHMDLQTTNMKTYKSHGRVGRREMIRPLEREADHDQPFMKDTVYTEEYTKKSSVPAVRAKSVVADDERPKPKGRFNDATTNKEFFKEPQHRQPAQRFGELPSFTHSLIFPDKENQKESLCSRTQLDFPYKTAKKPELIKGAEPNMKVGEGDHHLETTQRSSFKFIPNFPKIHSKSAKEPERRFSLPKMELTTRYKSDYGKRERLPKPRKPAMPAPDTLEIKMDDRQRIVTEQREQFHGWDVKKHRRPDPAKLSDNTELSDEPMASVTTMQNDFMARSTEAKRTLPVVKQDAQYEPKKGKFRDMTTNKRFFLDWGVNRRLRHGDFHEAYNEVMTLVKHPAPVPLPKSTTHSVFVPKYGRPRTSMKPDYKTIDTSLQNDFNTVTRATYRFPPASAYIPEDFVVKC